MSRYVLSRHVGLEGVRLSKPGHWGNLPFEDAGAARRFAEVDCGFRRVLSNGLNVISNSAAPPAIEQPPERRLRSIP